MSGAARAWLRGTLRRPLRIVVVALGVALMAVATTAALVGGDLLERLFVADAEAEWGAVDLEVRADENSVHEIADGRLLQTQGPDEVLAAAPRLLLAGAVAADGRSLPDVQVMGLGAEEQGFPTLRLLDGRPGAGADGTDVLLRTDPDEVLVNERLAERLDLAVGDPVQVVVAIPRWLEEVSTSSEPVIHPPAAVTLDVEVVGVVADEGAADLHRGAAVLLRRDALGRATGLDGYVTATHLRLVDRDPVTVGRAVDGLAHLTAITELDADPVRLEELALAEEDGGLFRSILLTMSALVVAAAAIAVRGLVVALAEERGREVATLRALGVRARGVARLVTVEGLVVGGVGAVLGAVAGLPLGGLVTRAIVDHFATLNTGRGREQVALEPDLAVAPVVLGALITLLVVGVTARSAGRLVATAPPAAVLRGAPLTPAPPPRTRPPVALLALGSASLGAGAATGGALVFIGATLLLGWWWQRRRRPLGPGAVRDRLDQRAAALGLVWSLAGGAALTDPAQGVQAGMGVLLVAGLTAIGCGTVLLVPRVREATRVVRSWLPLGPVQVALAAAASSAARERRRTAVTTATVGAVLFVVAALSVLGAAQGLPLERQGGGFDVQVRSVSPITSRELAAVPGVAAAAAVATTPLPQTAYAVGPDDQPGFVVPYPVRMVAATQELAAVQAYGLAGATEAVTTAADAIDLVARERGVAVVDRAALPEGARVGDAVVIDSGPAPRRLRLIAVLDTFLLRSVIANEADVSQLAELRLPDLGLLRAEPGTDPAALAARVAAELDRPGLVSEPLSRVREDVIAVNRTFTDTFTALLLLSVVVATGSVAAQVVRAARERRAEIAVLRAVGVRRRTAATVLAAEPLLAAVLGGLLGLAVGLGLLRVLFAVAFGDLPFVVRWAHVGGVAGGVLALLVLACGLAAATGVPREVALRDLG